MPRRVLYAVGGLLILANSVALAQPSSATFPRNPAFGRGGLCEKAPVVPLGEGTAQAVERFRPRTPDNIFDIAPESRGGGFAEVKACVSSDGHVVGVEFVSASPLLMLTGPLEGAKKWRFPPSNAAFQTILQFRFLPGDQEGEIINDQSLAARYLDSFARCRSSLEAGTSDVLSRCADLSDVATQLGPVRALEKSRALGLVGQAYFNQGRFADAQGVFQQRVDVAKKVVDSSDEVASAYRDLGKTFEALGNTKDAQTSYKKAEEIALKAKK